MHSVQFGDMLSIPPVSGWPVWKAVAAVVAVAVVGAVAVVEGGGSQVAEINTATKHNLPCILLPSCNTLKNMISGNGENLTQYGHGAWSSSAPLNRMLSVCSHFALQQFQ